MLSQLVVQTLSDHAGWVLDCARIFHLHHHGVCGGYKGGIEIRTVYSYLFGNLTHVFSLLKIFFSNLKKKTCKGL